MPATRGARRRDVAQSHATCRRTAGVHADARRARCVSAQETAWRRHGWPRSKHRRHGQSEMNPARGNPRCGDHEPARGDWQERCFLEELARHGGTVIGPCLLRRLNRVTHAAHPLRRKRRGKRRGGRFAPRVVRPHACPSRHLNYIPVRARGHEPPAQQQHRAPAADADSRTSGSVVNHRGKRQQNRFRDWSKRNCTNMWQASRMEHGPDPRIDPDQAKRRWGAMAARGSANSVDRLPPACGHPVAASFDHCGSRDADRGKQRPGQNRMQR